MVVAGRAPPDQPLFRFDKKSPQRLVGAAALLIAAYTLFRILWPLRWSLVSTWVVVEVIFYVLYWRPRYAELNEQPEVHEPKNLDGMKTFQRFLRFCKDLPKGIDYKAYYSGWFRGASFHDIKRGEQQQQPQQQPVSTAQHGARQHSMRRHCQEAAAACDSQQQQQ